MEALKQLRESFHHRDTEAQRKMGSIGDRPHLHVILALFSVSPCLCV